MNTIIHLDDSFTDEQSFRQWEIDNQHLIWSPSRLSTLAACPRKYQHSYIDQIRPKEKDANLSAGSMIHTGLHEYFATGSAEKAVQKMQAVYGEEELPSADDAHLALPKMEIVVRNYVDHWETHGTHQPIRVKYTDIQTDNLIAGRFSIDDDGIILLGESTLMMEVTTPQGNLWIQGLPDLPVEDMHGAGRIMDHKSTGGWLSDYWAEKYRISDQFRWYAIMLKELLGRPFQGAVLDGIYVGKYATSSTSKATKFLREEYDYDQTMLDETVSNARALERARNLYQDAGYFPQHTGLYCGSCKYLHDFCKIPTWGREIPPGMTTEPEIRSILDPRD